MLMDQQSRALEVDPSAATNDGPLLLRRLANEVHDALGGQVYAARLALSQLEEVILPHAALLPAELASQCSIHLGTLRTRLDLIYRAVRNIEHQLYPQALMELGLPRALELLVDDSTDLGLRGHCEVDQAALAALSPDHHLDVYRFVQEALTNAAKHAPGALVLVQVVGRGEQLRVEVHDDGPGLPDPDSGYEPQGKGLRSMKARADRLGGSLEIVRRDGKLEGASFLLIVPRAVA
jgi:signal transduction histidine kinase